MEGDTVIDMRTGDVLESGVDFMCGKTNLKG